MFRLGITNEYRDDSIIKFIATKGRRLATICILEKLPKSSYGTLLGEISEFYNNLLNSKFGIKSPSITKNGIQFSPKKITTDSRLAGIKDLSFKN